MYAIRSYYVIRMIKIPLKINDALEFFVKNVIFFSTAKSRQKIIKAPKIELIGLTWPPSITTARIFSDNCIV